MFLSRNNFSNNWNNSYHKWLKQFSAKGLRYNGLECYYDGVIHPLRGISFPQGKCQWNILYITLKSLFCIISKTLFPHWFFFMVPLFGVISWCPFSLSTSFFMWMDWICNRASRSKKSKCSVSTAWMGVNLSCWDLQFKRQAAEFEKYAR